MIKYWPRLRVEGRFLPGHFKEPIHVQIKQVVDQSIVKQSHPSHPNQVQYVTVCFLNPPSLYPTFFLLQLQLPELLPMI